MGCAYVFIEKVSKKFNSKNKEYSQSANEDSDASDKAVQEKQKKKLKNKNVDKKKRVNKTDVVDLEYSDKEKSTTLENDVENVEDDDIIDDDNDDDDDENTPEKSSSVDNKDNKSKKQEFEDEYEDEDENDANDEVEKDEKNEIKYETSSDVDIDIETKSKYKKQQKSVKKKVDEAYESDDNVNDPDYDCEEEEYVPPNRLAKQTIPKKRNPARNCKTKTQEKRNRNYKIMAEKQKAKQKKKIEEKEKAKKKKKNTKKKLKDKKKCENDSEDSETGTKTQYAVEEEKVNENRKRVLASAEDEPPKKKTKTIKSSKNGKNKSKTANGKNKNKNKNVSTNYKTPSQWVGLKPGSKTLKYAAKSDTFSFAPYFKDCFGVSKLNIYICQDLGSSSVQFSRKIPMKKTIARLAHRGRIETFGGMLKEDLLFSKTQAYIGGKSAWILKFEDGKWGEKYELLPKLIKARNGAALKIYCSIAMNIAHLAVDNRDRDVVELKQYCQYLKKEGIHHPLFYLNKIKGKNNKITTRAEMRSAKMIQEIHLNKLLFYYTNKTFVDDDMELDDDESVFVNFRHVDSTVLLHLGYREWNENEKDFLKIVGPQQLSVL